MTTDGLGGDRNRHSRPPLLTTNHIRAPDIVLHQRFCDKIFELPSALNTQRH